MKESLSEHIPAYIELLASDKASKGYKALMNYLMMLRQHFVKHHSDEMSVGSFYQGYMDMSYFALTHTTLKAKKLKVGLVFNHEQVQFELWFVGQNKQVQKKYWSILQTIDLKKYRLSLNGEESIIRHMIVENPDFKNMDVLTSRIEQETLAFINDMTRALTD